MSEINHSGENFERQGATECAPVSPALHVRPGQTAVEILAGTRPILRVYATEDREVVVRSIETGREVRLSLSRGFGVEVGRSASVVNSDFIGSNERFVSSGHCHIGIREFDEEDGHPIIRITDRGSTNGTFYEMLINNDSAQAKNPEKSVDKYLGEYAVLPGQSVNVPLLKDTSNSYDIFDEKGDEVGHVLACSNQKMIIQSSGYEGPSVPFGQRVDIDLSCVSGGSAKVRKGVVRVMGWRPGKKLSFTIEGNPAQPTIRNLGTKKFTVKAVSLYKPGMSG